MLVVAYVAHTPIVSCFVWDMHIVFKICHMSAWPCPCIS